MSLRSSLSSEIWGTRRGWRDATSLCWL